MMWRIFLRDLNNFIICYVSDLVTILLTIFVFYMFYMIITTVHFLLLHRLVL